MSSAAWLPFLGARLNADEGGFLLLAQHWSPGTSLYGNYWVDRPPLLLGLFWLAGHLGAAGYTQQGFTAPGVKLLGAAATGAVVVLTGVVTGLVAPVSSWSRRVSTVAVAALLVSPIFGMPETDGEILAAPFVLLGLGSLIRASQLPRGRGSAVLAAAAGAAAMCAALVKQNVVDVFVFALVLFVVTRNRDRALWARAGAFAAGSLTMLVATGAAASLRGTSPAELWDAIVTFRLEAMAVIGSSASPATAARLQRLALAFVGSGAAMALVTTALILVRTAWPRGGSDMSINERPPSRRDLTWPTLALVLWEGCGVMLGGSYWLHYLIGLIPGLALMIGLVRPSHLWRRVLSAGVVYIVVASLAVWTYHLVADPGGSSDAHVVAYLRAHAARSDGVIVAFGHPDIVAGSGLTSPYPLLWSLPVRVRDPQLHQLEHVLSGPSAPRWVVVAGETLGSWGIDAEAAQHYLSGHYVQQTTYGSWHIWQRR